MSTCSETQIWGESQRWGFRYAPKDVERIAHLHVLASLPPVHPDLIGQYQTSHRGCTDIGPGAVGRNPGFFDANHATPTFHHRVFQRRLGK